MRMIHKYVAILKMSIQQTLAYRATYAISLLASFVFILAMFYVWKAIYAGREILAGYTWEEMKAYLFVTFLTQLFLSWYSETSISWRIISGDVAMDLVKPLDFQRARFAESLGSGVAEGLVGAIFISLILIFFAGIPVPQSGLTWLLFIGSLVASVCLKFTIVYLAGLLCFWTSSAFGIAWSRAAITNLFSGALVPLPFFPGWLEALAKVLPFQGIVYVPASIFLGHLQGSQIFVQMALQWFWVIVLWMFGKVLWLWAVRQVTIHGG